MSLELVDPRTRRKLRSWQCQDDLANVAAFQEDPVVAAADMLELTLRDRDRRTLNAGGTTVPAAFDAYIGGLGRLCAADDDSSDHVADAIALLETATALDPSFALAHADLGRAHWTSFITTTDPEDSRKAAASAQRAVVLGGRMAAAHVTLGLVEAQAENYPAAVREFRYALDADPVNLRARWGLAEVSVSAGDHALADITYNEAVDLRRNHWAPHYRLGWYYHSQGRNDDALRVLAEASALAPGNPWPYILIGAIYFDTDRLDEAWAMWERSAELAPSREAYSNLGTSYFVESRYADASRMYEAALELDDSHYVTWGNLAAACVVVPGGKEKAVDCYARALELAKEQLKFSPHDAGLLASMAAYSAGVGDTAEARDFLGRSIALGPDEDQVMFEIGLTHEALGDRVAALEWIGRSVDDGFSREQVESTPALRELCADERYRRLVQRGGGR